MEDVTAHAVRLLVQTQSGGVDEVLPLSEELLRARTGNLADGPAPYHFVRAVSFFVLNQFREAISASDLMVAAADREDSPGWRACALSLRAELRQRLGEADLAEFDIDAVLRDLAAAEVALVAGEPDPVVAGNAHTGIALGYHQLRLYELADPHYQKAYEASMLAAEDIGNPAMWLVNLAQLHLEWALELYQVGYVNDAEKHMAEAERYALRSCDEATGTAAASWRMCGALFAACARADGPDPAAAAEDILRCLADVRTAGEFVDRVGLCQPFLAVALERSGRTAEALTVLEQAIAELPAQGEWLALAAARRTQVLLLSAQGAAGAAAGLAYGDLLATTMWRQRQQTLHTAMTMVSYQTLRSEHERVARAAETDPLTGVANRRGFDRIVAALAEQSIPGVSQQVAAILIDMDKFKLINDTLGHAAGDEALSTVARALAGCVRDGDVVARLGGDEFAALLPGAAPADAVRIAQRMVEAVRAVPDCLATLSVGVAGGAAAAVRDTLARADQAMYVAKRAGGDRVAAGPAPDPPTPARLTGPT
ncbi:MAG TPA: GGDEF domain-containing protein [Pilimelia sp.]|nr:GGDEF domain-containing protein [Pilimelia sp.]